MYKRPDGLWRDYITIDGKRKYFTGKTKAAVLAKIRGFDPQTLTPTVSRVVDDWQRTLDDLSPTTLPAYMRYSERFKVAFGDRMIGELRPVDIQTFLTEQITNYHMARNTASNCLSVVNRIMVFAVSRGDAEVNVARDIEIPRSLKKSERQMPDDDVLRKIQDADDTTAGLFLLFALYTGCRKGELLALTWEDVDMKSRLIRISKSVYYHGNSPALKDPKTEKGVRVVMIPDRLYKHLHPGTGLIFPDPVDGGLMKLSRYDDMIDAWRRDHDCDLTAHQLRHAYASMLEEAHVPEKTAQSLLGHAQISTTKDVYTHIRAQRAAKELQDLRSLDLDL